AAVVARHVGSEHHPRIVTAPSPELIERLVWHLDEPFADSSAVPTYFVSMAAREHVTVALSGDGGDELFAGYGRHRVEALEHRIRRVLGPRAGRAVARAAARLPVGTKGRNVLLDVGLPAEDGCARKFYFTPEVPRLKARLYSAWLRAETEKLDPLAPFRRAFRRAETADAVNRILNVDVATYLCDDILVKVDRMSMAHSLEVRAPLLDHKLVEFVATLPAAWKLNGGGSKVLLRSVLDGMVPRAASSTSARAAASAGRSASGRDMASTSRPSSSGTPPASGSFISTRTATTSAAGWVRWPVRRPGCSTGARRS